MVEASSIGAFPTVAFERSSFFRCGREHAFDKRSRFPPFLSPQKSNLGYEEQKELNDASFDSLRIRSSSAKSKLGYEQQKQLNDAFFDAVLRGDIKVVRDLLASRADGNYITRGGSGSLTSGEQVTALHLAAAAKQKGAQMLRLLAVELKVGGDVNGPRYS